MNGGVRPWQFGPQAEFSSEIGREQDFVWEVRT